MEQSSVICPKTLDTEWGELIKTALKMGISPHDISSFLRTGQSKTPVDILLK